MIPAQNSVWYAPHPQAVAAPMVSGSLPVSMLATAPGFALTRIEVLDASLYVCLDGAPASADSHDFRLDPTPGKRHTLLTDPSLVRAYSAGGRWKVAFETNLVAGYPAYRAADKVWRSAPGASSGLDLSLVTGSSDVFQTLIQVRGTGTVYITLDGRDASPTSYDYALSAMSGEAFRDAASFDVLPSKVRVASVGGTEVKIGYLEYTVGGATNWDQSDLYTGSGFRKN